MACCLTAPSHYLNQCWLVIKDVLWLAPESNFTRRAIKYSQIHNMCSEITFLKLLPHIPQTPSVHTLGVCISLRGQWVNVMSFSHTVIDEYWQFFFFHFQAFVGSGTNLQLSFLSNPWSEEAQDRVPARDNVDFDREPGKVSRHLIIFWCCDQLGHLPYWPFVYMLNCFEEIWVCVCILHHSFR